MYADRSMRSLKFTFDVLSVTGMWLPLNWQSKKLKKFFYRLYTGIAIFLTYAIVSLQLVLLLTSEFDMNLFSDLLSTFLTGISVCCKIIHFMLRVKLLSKVVQLNDMLFESHCRPMNDIEIEIQKKTDLFVRNFTLVFNALGQATLICFMMTPLLQDSTTRDLPFRLWLPYDPLNNNWRYWITYGFEYITLIIDVLLNVTTDVIVSGFVLQACTQLDLLRYRLNKIPNLVKSTNLNERAMEKIELTLLRQAIRQKSNQDFRCDIIVEQYFASVLLFSVLLYQFLMGDISPLQKVMALGFIICVIGELFAYCWFGNEITLKSMDLNDYVYMIDWTALSTKANKVLIFIMMRTSKPIIMSYGDLVVLNIESFKGIMKVTYSAFNLLKESGAQRKMNKLLSEN